MTPEPDKDCTVRLEIDDGVATVTLNRPGQMNALSRRMIDVDFPNVIQTIDADDRIRAIIITGAGEAFCAGADVKEILEIRAAGLPPYPTRQLSLRQLSHLIIELRKLKKPIIAAVNGMAAGGGFSLAAACDFRVVSEDAKFYSVFIKRGVIPDYGLTYFLPRIVGITKALEWTLLGIVVDSHEALSAGLVSRVVTQEQLLNESMKLAKALAAGPPIAIELTKLAMFKGLDNDLQTHADFETYAQNLCFSSEDFKEAVACFREKRQPVFSGN